MKISSINYTNPRNCPQNKSAKKTNKITHNQVNNLSTMPIYYTPLSDNVNFKGHELRPLSNREFRTLKDKVIAQGKKYGIIFGADAYAFKSQWQLQLTDFLLNHTVIRNTKLREGFDFWINMIVQTTSDRNRHESSYNHVTDIDDNLLKSNCEAIMDFADFISEHPIYSHPNVQEYLTTILGWTETSNIEKRKMMANYLNDNPDELDDFWTVYEGLGTGEWFKWNSLDSKYKPDRYSPTKPTLQEYIPSVNQKNYVVEPKEKQTVSEKPVISGFARVGGQDNAIKQLKQKILYPMKFPKVYEGRNIDKGIILYGPPGTGKSLLAQALSEECGCNFVKIGATDMENMYVGETEKQWQMLFDDLIRRQPSILFIDEADALCKARGSKDVYGDKELNKVLQLMSDIKLEDKQVFVILATNNFAVLDSAVKRDGRFGTHIEVLPPQTIEDVEQIFNIHTKRLKIDIPENERKGIFEEMLKLNYTGSAIEGVVGQAHDLAIERTGLIEAMENNTVTADDIQNLSITAEDILNAIALRDNKKNSPIGFKKE